MCVTFVCANIIATHFMYYMYEAVKISLLLNVHSIISCRINAVHDFVCAWCVGLVFVAKRLHKCMPVIMCCLLMICAYHSLNLKCGCIIQWC